jgi:glycosyltransferase involved in cell wall biosynthesis
MPGSITYRPHGIGLALSTPLVVLQPEQLEGMGLGLVVLEAWYYEVPVISTMVGGLRTLVKNNETGIAGLPCSRERLAEAILQLKENRDLAAAIVLKSKEVLYREYTMEAVYLRFIAMYKQIQNVASQRFKKMQ